MPLILGNNGVDLLLWNLRTQPYHSYQIYNVLINNFMGKLLKFIFALNLLKSFCLPSSEGIKQHRTYYGSVDYTAIAIEADESTPLLVDRVKWPKDNNNNTNKNGIINEKTPIKCGLSSLSINSSNRSSGSAYSFDSTKSFKSHFLELKVLAFAILLAAAISIAIYLLVIESRLPSITLSLDLVSRDIWNSKIILQHYHPLQQNNVDHLIIMQTGNRNCDTSEECLEVLKEMQINEAEELPFNFLIGGDGHTYEVRGWKYQSGIKSIPREQSLIIGIIGNFDRSSSKNEILRSVKSLIQLSSKRQLINKNYYIYILLWSDRERIKSQQLFSKIKE